MLPIPPGTHWSDAKPIVLPTMPADGSQQPGGPALPDDSRPRGPRKPTVKKPAEPLAKALRGFVFESAVTPPPQPEKPKRPPCKRPRVKNDPKYIAAARELRDRWLEHANAPAGAEALLSQGKYDVTRALSDARSTVQVLPAIPALPAPMAA